MSKMQKAFEKNKKYLILFLVLWIVLEIVLIAPIAVTVAESKNMDQFIANIINEISSLKSITKVLQTNIIPTFGKQHYGSQSYLHYVS